MIHVFPCGLDSAIIIKRRTKESSSYAAIFLRTKDVDAKVFYFSRLCASPSVLLSQTIQAKAGLEIGVQRKGGGSVSLIMWTLFVA